MRACCALLLMLGLLACDGGEGVDAGIGVDAGHSDSGVLDAGPVMSFDVVYEVQDIMDDSPLVGVTIAIDTADGTRVEEMTDVIGRASFSLDAAAGPFDVTMYSPDHLLTSSVGVGADAFLRSRRTSEARPRTTTWAPTTDSGCRRARPCG